jgi:hypothetical protein
VAWQPGGLSKEPKNIFKKQETKDSWTGMQTRKRHPIPIDATNGYSTFSALFHRSEKPPNTLTGTHIDEVPSNWIIRPIPRVKIAKATHITGRYCPVRETKTPATAEKNEHPKEKVNILHIELR